MIIFNFLDAVKASTCYYSGFFLLKYIISKKDNFDNVEILKLDFCNKYLTTLPLRTAFIIKLLAVPSTASDADFSLSCLTELHSIQGLNEWFDPIDPMVTIS